MLIQFTVGNFKSFKDKSTFSLEATYDNCREDDIVVHLPKERLLKAAAIYGPNAGGKSNFLAAMRFFCEFIKKSSKDTQQGDQIPVMPFRLHTETETAPSYFEAVVLQKGIRYRYGFEATQQAIQSEWLYSRADSTRETTLFKRVNDVIKTTDAFKEGKGLEVRTRSNALFLSVVAQFNGEIAGEILNWTNHFQMVSGLNDGEYMNFTANLLSDSEYGPLLQQLVKQADLGIKKMERQDKLPDAIPQDTSQPMRELLLRSAARPFTVKTLHQHFNAKDKPDALVEFDLDVEESAGTQKLVALTGPFLKTLREGSILFVDELEARLHPLLTKALVELFNGSANQKNAQLVFVTHDESLLDSQRIRRDQVWFVEKDRFGASRLFCLHDVKAVRKAARLAKKYLLGEFGGVPRIGDLQKVLDQPANSPGNKSRPAAARTDRGNGGSESP